MSEKSVILHEEITSSQAETVSVVGSARNLFAISISLHVPLKRNFVWIWSKKIRVEFWNSLLIEIMAKLMKMRGWRYTSRVRMSMLFVVLPRWRSPGLISNSRVWVAGFQFLRGFPRKGLEGQTLSECVFDTARPPQCEFSNLHTSLAFGLLE